jgi:hypothetical protein
MVKNTDAGWSSSVARWAHNPEVAGSNPAPATSFRSSRPFPGRERAFCVSGTVVEGVAATALRAARRRDGGDGVTRDETAWTRWTLPPAISGCLAQRYRKCIPVSSHSCWTTRTIGNRGLGQGRQRLVVVSGGQEREIGPLLESSGGVAGRRSADATTYVLRRALPARWVCPGSRVCHRRSAGQWSVDAGQLRRAAERSHPATSTVRTQAREHAERG